MVLFTTTQWRLRQRDTAGRNQRRRTGFEASRAGVSRRVSAWVPLRRGVASSETCLLRDAQRSRDKLQDLMRTALFRAITRRVVVIPYRRFGTTYRSHLQRSRIQEALSCDRMWWRSWRKRSGVLWFPHRRRKESEVRSLALLIRSVSNLLNVA